jgi:signal transduction histidine kinase
VNALRAKDTFRLPEGQMEEVVDVSQLVWLCRRFPDKFIHTPTTTQSAQQLILDGKNIKVGGDPSFNSPSDLYISLRIPCAQIVDGVGLLWKVTSSSSSISIGNSRPFVTDSFDYPKLVNSTLNTVAALSIPMIALLGGICFARKLSSGFLAQWFISCLLFSVFFLSTVPESFEIGLSYLWLRKIGDSALWLGTSFITFFLNNDSAKLPKIPKIAIHLHGAIVSLSSIAILLSSNLDQLQLYSNIAAASSLLVLCSLLAISVRELVTRRIRLSMTLVALFFFVATGLNDLIVTNLSLVFDYSLLNMKLPLFPTGVMACSFVAFLALNENINEVYSERENLRKNLENIVEDRTQALRTRTVELEVALKDLKFAQSELAVTSKLAAMGTFAAGLAHEVNNALNYVKGAANGLKKRYVASGEEKEKALAETIIDGVNLIGEIVRILRSNTTEEQPKDLGYFTDVKSVVSDVLKIVSRKVESIDTLTVDIPEGIVVDVPRAVLFQILSNLVSNACDAFQNCENEKKLAISALRREDLVEIHVADNGTGIPQEVSGRLFEPFFSTKGPGGGMGLGLYFVRSMSERHNGRVCFESSSESGTVFIVSFHERNREVAT